MLREIYSIYHYIKNSPLDLTSYLYITFLYVCQKKFIILHFYTSSDIKEKRAEFLLFETFCSLVRNENIKRPGFYTLQVTRVFSNFPYLKQLNKIKNTCEYCHLFDL